VRRMIRLRAIAPTNYWQKSLNQENRNPFYIINIRSGDARLLKQLKKDRLVLRC